ncbi:MAG: dihydrofolate reductase, partial [Candidatus Phytoplasma sp.]|nr:dihydrofolate reductase [Phytoplasma sp.]
MISLIWAMDTNWLIGLDDKLPWRYKEDLMYFKQMVKDQTVIMGDVTYHSLKGYYKDKPFPFGKIYVCTLDQTLKIDGVNMVYDLHAFLQNNS